MSTKCYNEYTKKRTTLLKTRKATTMTKNTMTTLINYLTANDIPELADVKAELLAQAEKNAVKAQANKDAYDAVQTLVENVLTDEPQTVAEVYEQIKDELPEGFSKGKVQSLFTRRWEEFAVRHDNGKKAFTYTMIA